MNTTQWMLLSSVALMVSCISDINNPLAVDNDGDGFTELQGDCDDSQALAFPGVASLDSDTECMLDLDGDGYGDSQVSDTNTVVSGSDCDDSSPESTYKEIDFDCDGILTDDDCDDENAASTALAEDADCDGVMTEIDCDDNDPSSTTMDTDPTVMGF